MPTPSEQLTLEIEATPSQPPREDRTPEQVRYPVRSMVSLALALGYARDLEDLIDQVAALRQYRLFNGLLAILQRPHATHLLSAHTWDKRWKRMIKPGEHPIVLLAPHAPVVFLFDVSQTEADGASRDLPPWLVDPYLTPDVQPAPVALMNATAAAAADGVRVQTAPRGRPAAGCIRETDTSATQPVWQDAAIRQEPVRYEVLLNSSHSPTQQLATLAHELGHLYCGHLGSGAANKWPDRLGLNDSTREHEAQLVARLVFRRIAPHAELPAHLDNPHREASRDVCTATVVKAADRVIDMCHNNNAQ